MSEDDYTNRILSAIENAAPMHRVGKTWELVTPKDLADYLNLYDLKDALDDHPVFLDIDPTHLPYVVLATTPDELRRILDKYLEINQEILPVKQRKLEIRHEAEHGEAAKKLGAQASNYGLEFYKSADGDDLVWQLTHFPRGLHTTKLGLAILNAYPLEPSKSDLVQIGSLGYRDVAEVATRARKNALPIPLSVRD